MVFPEYERLQIESVLGASRWQMHRGIGLVMLPPGEEYAALVDLAIGPAMRLCGLNPRGLEAAFDADTPLADVAARLAGAEVIIADTTMVNPSVLYLLGLCHGLGRCPIIIVEEPYPLPFGLEALRRVSYKRGTEGALELREELARVIRVYLAAARAGGP